MLVRSRYIEKIRPFVGLDVVKVITGIRRSGKSVLLQQIQDEIAQNVDPAGVFVRINLEEEENSRFLSKGVVHAHVLNIAKKSRDRKVYVFLDEVHDMEDWEIFLYFLKRNRLLLRKDGSKRIADHTLVALTVMIACSKPQEKELMVNLVMTFLK